MSDVDPIEPLMNFIQNELRASPGAGSISAEDDLLGGGHIDSMGIMRLVTFLESEFGVSVPPEDVTIDHFQSGNTIAEYIRVARVDQGS
ncbi:MAG: acyl carrier protein [Planctomycetota bacterium]